MCQRVRSPPQSSPPQQLSQDSVYFHICIVPSPIFSGTRFPALPLGCKPSLAKLSLGRACPHVWISPDDPAGASPICPALGGLSQLLLPAGSESLPRQSWALRCFKKVDGNTYSASILKPDSLFGLFKTKHITDLMTQETGFFPAFGSQNISTVGTGPSELSHM